MTTTVSSLTGGGAAAPVLHRQWRGFLIPVRSPRTAAQQTRLCRPHQRQYGAARRSLACHRAVSTNPLTAAGRHHASDFILTSNCERATIATHRKTGIGTTGAPFTGTLANFARAVHQPAGRERRAPPSSSRTARTLCSTRCRRSCGDLGRQYRRRDGASARAAECLLGQRARDVVHQADVRHADPGHVRVSCLSMALTAGHPISGPRSSTCGSQLDDLTQQLASGRVSTTYAGQGADRGFALSLRAQVIGSSTPSRTPQPTSIPGSASSTLH